MKSRRKVSWSLTLTGLLLAVPLGAQTTQSDSAAQAQRAVQEFYSWYVPMAAKTPSAWMHAIRKRRTTFAPAIVRALRGDSVAAAAHPSEVVGLDGDPFLNAQDPCDRYDAVRTTAHGRVYLVEVLGTGGCVAHTKPDVVVEVARAGGKWVFMNFRYLDPNDNLLDLLKRLRSGNGKSSR
jgi:Protein of unknown function (DUF3828)